MGWIPKNTIIVPVDFSDDSLDAVDTALELAASAANLYVVHVLPELSPLEPGELWETIDNESRTQHAEKALRERLSKPEHADLNIEILFGDAGHQIAQRAEELQAEMIVLPSHGRTGLSHLLIGSVAERVVRLAHCPVLVLRK
jgi:nucleotide-binding universal stress UspA family protein